jgi:hypothetical protein
MGIPRLKGHDAAWSGSTSIVGCCPKSWPGRDYVTLGRSHDGKGRSDPSLHADPSARYRAAILSRRNKQGREPFRAARTMLPHIVARRV